MDTQPSAFMLRSSPSSWQRGVWLLGLMVVTLLGTACSTILFPSHSKVPGGDPERGAVALQTYGCGACHAIPGVPGAVAYVGPPLDAWAERHYIAGTLLNTPDNLIIWLREPQSVEADTAMPNLGITEQDARDMSAYLYTLREYTLRQ